MALTSIVITFGISAFLLALAYRSWTLTGDDMAEDDVEDRRIAQFAATVRGGDRQARRAPGARDLNDAEVEAAVQEAEGST